MEIFHRVTFTDEDGIDAFVKANKIKYLISPLPGDKGGYLIHLDINESDPSWPQIEAFIKEKRTRLGHALDMYDTAFSEAEIRMAEWVRFSPGFEQGYPQPEKGMGWEKLTYEKVCSRCGIDFNQKAPFHIAKEPRMGKNEFVSLYWTETAFCTEKVLESLNINEIKGYDVWPAIIHRTNEPSKLISQLIFPYVAQPGLAGKEKLEPTCPACGITKYAYHNRGHMHYKRDAILTDVDCQLTNEWFGSGGHSGWREMLISSRFANLILNERWKRLRLKPLKLF